VIDVLAVLPALSCYISSHTRCALLRLCIMSDWDAIYCTLNPISDMLVRISPNVNVCVMTSFCSSSCRIRHPHLLGIGALSLAGMSLPLVSLTFTSRGGGVLSLEVMRLLLNLSRFLLLSRGSMAAVSSSSCSSSSSSTNSPSAVS
jgi:hypothetical protein